MASFMWLTSTCMPGTSIYGKIVEATALKHIEAKYDKLIIIFTLNLFIFPPFHVSLMNLIRESVSQPL